MYKSLPWGDKRSDALSAVSTNIFIRGTSSVLNQLFFNPWPQYGDLHLVAVGIWRLVVLLRWFDLLRVIWSVQAIFNPDRKTITRVYKGSALHKQSLADLYSVDQVYRQDENAPNAVSYYAKGALAALALDLYIRRETGNQKSLDDDESVVDRVRFQGIRSGRWCWTFIERITGLDLSDLLIRSCEV